MPVGLAFTGISERAVAAAYRNSDNAFTGIGDAGSRLRDIECFVAPRQYITSLACEKL